MRSLPSRLGTLRPRTRSGGNVNSIDDTRFRLLQLGSLLEVADACRSKGGIIASNGDVTRAIAGARRRCDDDGTAKASYGSGARDTDVRRARQAADCRCTDRKMRIPHPKSCGIRTGGSTTPSSGWVFRCRSVGMCLAMTVRRR